MNVSRVVEVLESIAPLEYAEQWDNVGLLIGSRKWAAERILLTIDLTERVLSEAIRGETQMIVAYHPPIFKKLKALTDETVKQRIALQAAGAGIAVFSPHTALDAAPGGVNDWLAAGFGEGDVRALQSRLVQPPSEAYKIVTFCPADAVEHVRNGLASMGAGRIGDYEVCSFTMEGVGTFLGGDTTNPAVGQRGVLEAVDEVRLEMVCAKKALGLAVLGIREFHPYEEPPIDIYRLEARPERSIGAGRRVVLDQAKPLDEVVQEVKGRLGVERLRVAVAHKTPEAYRTIGMCAGAGGDLLGDAIDQGCEAFLTGEMRHHDVLEAQERGCTVILAGHTNTERGYLPLLRERMVEALPGLNVTVSKEDEDPLKAC
jgi:dinuclear metal center YbgI/SA1388 family protein